MAFHKLSALVFFLLFGNEISKAARALTAFGGGEYANPSSQGDNRYGYVGANGVGGYGGEYGGEYSPKGSGYGKYKNNYYSGQGTYDQGGIGSSYGVPGYNTEKGKGNDYEYGEQYGQSYSGGGRKQEGSSNKYDSSYASGCKDEREYKYPSYRNSDKGSEPSKEYGDYRNSDKGGESYEGYNTNGNGEKNGGTYKYSNYESGDKSFKEYNSRQGSSVYGGGSGTEP